MPDRQNQPSKSRLAKVRLVVFDFDGVFTDNFVWISDSGERHKAFWVPDGVGIFMAHRLGLKFAIITGNDDVTTRHRAEYLRIAEVYQNVYDKGEVYDQIRDRHNLADDEILYIGDDLPDRAVFHRDCLTLAPSDAHPEIRKLAKWIGRKPGGRGIVREAIDAILAARGFDWTPATSRQVMADHQ